ncbi:phage tail tape measure protein [Sporosarcina sp. Sa2YVA2]|uniref:Phage tail tape measure protein n=1 Tax=Sporosarcina quadrami TaxID=2762234 RepID=A0ABR8UBB2_9BACL|nr:phage tail tape measure protein [Sporosarcina quadrami]MBD7985325.1 phage tail tape measure protein [Sporosarcina quadrami]
MASKDVGSLRTRLSWEDDGADKSLKGFRDDLKSLRTEMGVAKSSGKEYAQSLKGLREQSDILTRTLKTQKEQVTELRKRYEESKRVKGEDSDQTRKLSDEYNKAVAAMNRTEGQLERVNGALRDQMNPLKNLGKQWEETGAKIQSIGKGLTDFGKDYSMKVTAPIVAVGAAAFKASVDYESAFAGIRKTTDASEEEFAALSKGIREMARELPVAATEIAAVGEAAGQLGIAKEDILEFSRVMIDLGESSNLSADQAATQLARFANITQMSMKDIRRLGSVIVDLGNNSATTESDIVSMGMRLSGVGAQMGMSEANIMSLAAAMSSVGIEAEAGGSAMSAVMKKINTAVANGGQALDEFAEVAHMSATDFAESWKSNPIEALDLFIKGVAKSGEEGENLAAILGFLGIKGIREQDTLLRLAGAADLLSYSVGIGNTAWEENIALTNEAAQRYGTTESQLKIMWNRVKDMAITLGDALIPAVMAAIEAAEPLIQQIESGAKAFADMDKEQQETIIKMIALVAAVGPASIALGGLTTTIGGVVGMGGKLMSTLGKAGGTGMLGSLGMMGPAAGTPVGLAVLGIGALAAGVYVLDKAMYGNLEATVRSIEKRQEEIASLDKLIAAFELLKLKNKLTTDEMLRYMDIATEIKNARTEDAIKALSEEQQKLMEKSGLTNEEMERFLDMNDKLIQKAPSTAKAISEQGNAYAAVTDEIKKLNAEEARRLADDTYVTLTNEMGKQAKLLKDQKGLTNEIKKLENEREAANKLVSLAVQDLNKHDLETAKLRERTAKASGEERVTLEKMVKSAEEQRNHLDAIVFQHQDAADKIGKQIGKKQESLNETNKELKAFDDLSYKYEELILSQVGITSERGEGIKKLQEEQRNIDESRKRLEAMKNSGAELGAEYDEQNKKLTEQQNKIDQAKRKLNEMNEIAKARINKDIYLNPQPTIESINSKLSASISKTVNIQMGQMPVGYAASTSYRKENAAIVGCVE